MGLTMHQRKAVTNELAQRYQRSSKGERGRLLNEFIQLTGYARAYASHILHNWGTHHIRIVDGERVEVIIGTKHPTPHKRKRARHYDTAAIAILEKLWMISDGLCGKRLHAFIQRSLPVLERFGEITLGDDVLRSKLLKISPATIDRLMAPTRKRTWVKQRSSTKPGTLLKHHIPIRTFADWNEKIPGFLEIDLVAHDGGTNYGEFMQSLNATDIATGWTETRAIRSKAQRWVLSALYRIKKELPFPMLGIDSDNGGEFINNHLLRFCAASHTTFTRSRPFRKNDNCFVEQKNYSIVRRAAGYYRYDNDQQLALLEQLYAQLRLYTNYFQPVMKLVSKTRIGSSVKKHYDTAQTPFERLLNQSNITSAIKDKLSVEFSLLNPAQLKRSLSEIQEKLFLIHTPLPDRRRGYHTITLSHPWRRTGKPVLPKQGQTKLDSQDEICHPASPP